MKIFSRNCLVKMSASYLKINFYEEGKRNKKIRHFEDD